MIRLKKLRTEKGMTQLDVCAASKVAPSYISAAESRGLRLGENQARRVAKAVEWQGDPAELFEEVGE